MSATPGPFEKKVSKEHTVEQIVPTGLLDPEIEVRPARTQVDDLLAEIRKTVAAKARVLVTTLTKRMAEDLTNYYADIGIKVRYLHSEIDALERSAILRDLRLGAFDVLVGINLLREGLDLPEVALVAILDADKEGFLRGQTSLIQTCGRAARNAEGRVIFYADGETESMRLAMDEVSRRRAVQLEWNADHGLEPKTIFKPIREGIEALYEMDYPAVPDISDVGPVTEAEDDPRTWPTKRLRGEIARVRADMLLAAGELAIRGRDGPAGSAEGVGGARALPLRPLLAALPGTSPPPGATMWRCAGELQRDAWLRIGEDCPIQGGAGTLAAGTA